MSNLPPKAPEKDAPVPSIAPGAVFPHAGGDIDVTIVEPFEYIPVSGEPEPAPKTGNGATDPALAIDTHTVDVTFFKNKAAAVLRVEQLTLRGIADRIAGQTAHDKAKLPLLELKTFGAVRTVKNCLRHDANVVDFGGIEGDADDERLSFDEAVTRARKAGVRALLYTSPSWVKGSKEKWRVLLPLSQTYPPERRPEFVAWANGLFGGAFSGETFTLSQSYYYGHIGGHEYRVEIIDGDFLDRREDLAEGAIGKPVAGVKAGNGAAAHETTPADWAPLIAAILEGSVLHPHLVSLSAKLVKGGLNGGAAVNFLRSLLMQSAAPRDDRWQERWDDVPRIVSSAEQFRLAPPPDMDDTVAALLRDYDPETGEVIEDPDPNGAGGPSGGAGTPAGSASTKPGGNAGAGTKTPQPIEPVDLWAKFEPPPLPRGLLPSLLEEFVFERSAVMGCDPTGLALGALAVCAASIPEDIRIQPKRNDTKWQESARLWVALVGGVSEMKSPILDTVAARIREIDYEMERAYQEALGKYFALDKKIREKTPRPKHLRTKIMNTTVEAAADILKDSPNGVLLEQDELSGWFGSMDKYSGSRGAQADRAFWLQGFNGKPYTVDRVVRGSTYIPHLSVSILGFIQPEPIRKIADGGEDDGLMQRFITGILTPAVKGGDVAPGPALFDYEDMVENLRKLKPSRSGNLYPPDVPLTFDSGALKIRVELEDKHRELQQCKTINRKLTSHIGKYNGIFARLCLIWHCIEHVDDEKLPAVITEHTARRVADFLHDFLLKHALAFYAGVLGLANDHDRLANIASYILAHQKTRLTNRDIERGDRSMRNLKDYETAPIFEQLEALGWLTRIPGPRFNAPLNWVVNSVVHQRFADRAKSERERRERDRQIIAEYLATRGSE